MDKIIENIDMDQVDHVHGEMDPKACADAFKKELTIQLDELLLDHTEQYLAKLRTHPENVTSDDAIHAGK